MSTLSQAIQAVDNYETKQHSPRLHRIHDGRWDLLMKALLEIEERDHAVYPTVEKVSTTTLSVLALGNATGSPFGLFVCTGTNFSTDEDAYSIRIGGLSPDTLVVQAGATATEFTVYLSEDTVVVENEQLLVQIRLNGVLLTEFFMTVVA